MSRKKEMSQKEKGRERGMQQKKKKKKKKKLSNALLRSYFLGLLTLINVQFFLALNLVTDAF